MAKRGVFVLILLVALMLTLGVALAQEGGSEDGSVVENSPQAEDSGGTSPAETEEPTPPQDSQAEDSSVEGESNEELLDDNEVYSDIEDTEFDVDPGLTPGDTFYFIDNALENALVGDNPERALDYKEEKVAEANLMIEQGRPDDARDVLDKVSQYGDILEREVSPEIEKRAIQSSKSVKELLKKIEAELEGDEWKEVKEKIKEHEQKEDKIALAAKISGQIRDLCQSLSEIDPLEYDRVCSVDDKSPRWQRTLNEELTEEQKDEAEEFFKVMSSCFENPRECECDKIKIESFSNQCSIIAPLAADCEEGDESACEAMDEMEDPIELLPPHLQDVMENVERRYNDDRFDLHMPIECQEEGAKTPEQCMKVMFRVHAPQECIDALDNGEIKFSNEREARQQCEEIMFNANAPPECIEAGLKDHRDCEKLMFEINAPPECVEAGLTGENRLDHRKCEELMRRLGENQGPMNGGFGGGNCRNIQDAEERLSCYDGATQGVQDSRERGPQGGWPQPCEEAGARDRQSCEQVMRKFGEERSNMEQESRKDYRKYYDNRYDEKFKETMERERQCVQRCSSEGKAWDFTNGNCQCRGGDNRDYERESRDNYPRPPQDHPEDYPRDFPPQDKPFNERRGPEGGFPPPGDYPQGDYPRDLPNGDFPEGDRESPEEPSTGGESGGSSGEGSSDGGSGSDSGSSDSGSSDGGGSSEGSSGGDSGSSGGSSDSGSSDSGGSSGGGEAPTP